jgi:ankyrin repeat protein
MHGGVNFQPYKNQFSKLIGNEKMNYLEAYNASEGFFAIQDQKISKEMLLMLDYGVFYEFIKKENFDKQSYDAIGLKDIKLNTNYILIISTNSGLWRYQIGDIIEFTSINPFRIIIKGRVMSCLNTFGEELIVNNSDNAIEFACEKTNSEIVDYTVAPIFISNSAGSHEWAIEFKKAPHNTNEFMQIIDDHLKHLNSDYEAKRFNDLILKKPKLNIIKKGIFLNWLSLKNKLGGQNKIPRLNEKRTFIEEIKKLNL